MSDLRSLSQDSSVVTSSDDDYFYSNSKYYPHGGNSSITTSVTIRVTPEHYHLFNWALLWGGFLFGIVLASYQVRRENHWFNERRRDDLEQQQAGIHEGGLFSAGNLTRRWFRRLLLWAMISRTVMIPVQMWSKPLWIQFVADTLPEINFACAWILLITFFVQLVAVAVGTGNSTRPGWAIQVIVFCVYAVVLGTYFWNPVASVLLYALLCSIYAALFGIAIFICPRLVYILRSSFEDGKGLAVRLVACSLLFIFVLGARTVGFARKVVAPPRVVSWWWQYGILELLPSIALLAMMHPKGDTSSHGTSLVNGSRSASPGPMGMATGKGSSSSSQHKRQDSQGSWRRQGETTPLLQSAVGH